jgi:hypothetical protein
MKKLFLLFVVVQLTQMIIAQDVKKKQEPILFFGLGLASFSEDTKESSNLALNMGFAIYNFYFDFSSNLSTGKGEELDFTSSYTIKSNKLQVSVFNLGYAIRINKVSIIPLLGYGWTRGIYEDSLAFDTYYFGESKGDINIGAMGVFDLAGKGGLYAGLGTFENFKIGIWIGF